LLPLFLEEIGVLEDIDQQGDDQQHADDRPNDSASSQDSLLCVSITYPIGPAAKRNVYPG
jgi:hypothetical protein